MAWQEALWEELDSMSDIEQIVKSAAWIEEITHSLSPALARRRREKIRDVLGQDGWDATMLAESIGSRRSTIKRLYEEARADERERDRHAA